jgi:predicted transcriptional regulator
LTRSARALHADGMTDTVQAPEVVAAVKRKAGRPKGVKRAASKLTQGELATVVLDYARGVQQGEIARKMGISDSAVSLILDKFKPAFGELQNVEEYRRAKAALLDSASLTVLKEIVNPSKIEAADVRALSGCYDVLNKHSRLERGESTSNVQQQTIALALNLDTYGER